MMKTSLLMAALAGLLLLSQPAFAGHKRHVPPETHPNHAACVRGGWNDKACAHLRHYGDSSDYYHHHDHRHHHGMALD